MPPCFSQACRPDDAANGPLGGHGAWRSAPPCAGGIAVVNGIPHFQDTAHFIETYECLFAEFWAHNEWFDSTYKLYSIDLHDSIAQAIGFDEYETVAAFENHFGCSTLRQTLNDAEDTWLDNMGDSLDLTHHPENKYFHDDVLQALFDRFGTVAIGNSLYWIEGGSQTVYEVKYLKYNLLSRLQAQQVNPERNDTIVVYDFDVEGKTASVCSAWRTKTPPKRQIGSNWMGMHIEFKSIAATTWVSACTEAYKRKNNKWKKDKQNICVNRAALSARTTAISTLTSMPFPPTNAEVKKKCQTQKCTRAERRSNRQYTEEMGLWQRALAPTMLSTGTHSIIS